MVLDRYYSLAQAGRFTLAPPDMCEVVQHRANQRWGYLIGLIVVLSIAVAAFGPAT